MNVSEWVFELFTLGVMAFALGMDAFSVGLGMGMLKLRLSRIFFIGIIIGLFHIIMPLAGMLCGNLVSAHFGGIAAYIGGGLLLILGFQMIMSSFRSDSGVLIMPVGVGLIVFALSVSLDSFSVGLSLGIYGARIIIAAIVFGIISTILTWLGLILGRKVQDWVGSYGEALGGSILFAIGLKLIFM
ncbi:manganese efflux pump MntP family protein [Bacillus solimangrovi]|uniref:Putative manganese efflux pump MntP n=1 Tax=Bacillus solimangrovi TaxID=1305675 RepID=A0A1E5LGV5_9BACI|nr:manganese efflux pump [Bacillus solimangrovi]OEH93302.1 hypothetical protein BFG57_12305 [Bacillus solimangrovi]